jgi:Protein of unknown function (DUF3551)
MVRLIAGAFAFALATLAFAAPMPAAAETLYPWCLQYSEATNGGATNCGFVTLAQCRATLSGLGGACYENPAFPNSATPRPKRRRTTQY